MIRTLLSRLAAALGLAVAATAAVVALPGTAVAGGLCELDRPCSYLTYNSATATVTARISDFDATEDDPADFFQVRWTINRNGAVQTFPQQKIAHDFRNSFTYASFGPIAPADRGFVIDYSAQSCISGVFGSSCSPWETESIVPLPYGPDTCAAGYVWRDAFPGDHICVTPASRNQAASDNAAAASRVNPQGAYGPNTCVNGYVWRVARSTDLVCVTPAIRTQTANENANPNAHRA
ncbi:hypothetical protein [Pseudonocardia lacus]|uniref:hypothetical protein n=1 Tax=Pseudonocardia lacus TaxID=2835865 RepID=UPI001BDBCC6A|nr:hypothetical protein [Pseudonocardia lacus]